MILGRGAGKRAFGVYRIEGHASDNLTAEVTKLGLSESLCVDN
jgi:hypothetical protein